MKHENVLLIGGPCDGQWRQVAEGLREIRLATLPRGPAYWEAEVEVAVASELVEYRRVPFQSDMGFKGAVFVFGDIDPMVALIEGYRKP
jgi:hypothetical protein